MDTINREAEACDCLQGIQLLHSLGGGTGSGLGSLILSKLYEYNEYDNCIMQAYSITPANRDADYSVPYNTLLAL